MSTKLPISTYTLVPFVIPTSEVASICFSDQGLERPGPGMHSLVIYIQCLGESYNASYFFSFFVSGQAASVNDIQGIRLYKPNKMKLLWATKLRRRGSH